MDLGNLQPVNDLLPALLPRNPAAADRAPRSSVAPIELQDVFSPSAASGSVAAFVAKAQALEGDREDIVAGAAARLRSGELDGSEVDKSTAAKILHSLRDETLGA